MTTNRSPRFGPCLRGFRLGYAWYEPWKAMVRTRDALANELGTCVIELAPPETKCMTSGKGKTFRNWYNEEDKKHLPEGVNCILELADVPELYYNPQAYIKLHLNDEGKVLGHEYSK